MNKQQVMEALVSADCNIPADVIGFIGANLKDVNGPVRVFDHDKDTVWEACGIVEDDAKELTRTLNTFMNNLPSGERQKSKAIEFIINSGNFKWFTILTVIGLEKIHNDGSEKSSDDDFKEMILKALMRKMRDRDEE